MYRELQRWALILSIVIFVSTILAAFVPQWIVVQPYSRAYGLYRQCTAGYCGAINWAELYTNPFCKNGCWSNKFIRRFHAVEAMMWIAAASLFLAAVGIASGFHRDLIHTARIMGPVIFFLTLAVIAYITALAIFGSTVSLHSAGFVCDFATGCLYWGPSSITAFVGLALSFIAWLLAVFSVCTRNARQRGVLLAWAFLLSVAALAFTLGSVLSDKWLYRSLPYSNLQNGWSIGPFQVCTGGSCQQLGLIWLLNTSCKNNNAYSYHGALRARFIVGEVFLILAIVTSLIVFFCAWRNWPMRTFIVLFVTFAFLVIGISVLGDTWDWWFGCGNGSYCDYVTLTYGFDCGWGFAFAAALVAVLTTALLLVAWIIMWACRKEDRAPDTTQVAVTTIAQPPAVPVGPRGAPVGRA